MIVSPWYPVPPVGYGGIELMAYQLARELQQRGHEVSVIGQQGSKGPFETIAIAPESWSSQLGTRAQVPRESLFLYRAYELVRRRAFDVVHDHSGIPGILLAAGTRLQTPVVATIHGDLTEAEGEFLAAVDHRVHLVAISNAQQAMGAGDHWRRAGRNPADPPGYRLFGHRRRGPGRGVLPPRGNRPRALRRARQPPLRPGADGRRLRIGLRTSDRRVVLPGEDVAS